MRFLNWGEITLEGLLLTCTLVVGAFSVLMHMGQAPVDGGRFDRLLVLSRLPTAGMMAIGCALLVLYGSLGLALMQPLVVLYVPVSLVYTGSLFLLRRSKVNRMSALAEIGRYNLQLAANDLSDSAPRLRLAAQSEQRNRPDLAERWLNSAIKADQKITQSYLRLSDLLVRQGRSSDALIALETACRAVPENDDIIRRLALMKNQVNSASADIPT